MGHDHHQAAVEAAPGVSIKPNLGLAVEEIRAIQAARTAFAETVSADEETLDLFAALAGKIFAAAYTASQEHPALKVVGVLSLERTIVDDVTGEGHVLRFQIEKVQPSPNAN